MGSRSATGGRWAVGGREVDREESVADNQNVRLSCLWWE